MSPDQRKQALRVFAVPTADFEAAVESAKPPTVTELAARGKKPSTAHLHGRDPAEFEASTRAQGAIRQSTTVVSTIDPAVAVRGALPHEYEQMAAHERALTTWLAALRSELQKATR